MRRGDAVDDDILSRLDTSFLDLVVGVAIPRVAECDDDYLIEQSRAMWSEVIRIVVIWEVEDSLRGATRPQFVLDRAKAVRKVKPEAAGLDQLDFLGYSTIK